MAANSRPVLLIEDDSTLAAALQYNLEREGFRCLVSIDGTDGLLSARRDRPVLVVLDVMLPGIDGLEVCRRLRSESTVPIIMLSARGEEVDRVVGLEVGADDYLTKPFKMRELLARVRAAIRRSELRSPPDPSRVMTFGSISIDPGRRELRRDSVVVRVKPKEFDLLSYLVQHPGQVFTREQLLDRVWGYDTAVNTRTVDVHMRWLREKVEPDAARPIYLLTSRGVGYKFEG